MAKEEALPAARPARAGTIGTGGVTSSGGQTGSGGFGDGGNGGTVSTGGRATGGSGATVDGGIGGAGAQGGGGATGTVGTAGTQGAAGTSGSAGSGFAGAGGATGGGGTSGNGGSCPGSAWAFSRSGNLVSLNYGSGPSYPQFGVIDVTSGYARFVYGASGGWGPSIILPPSFWSGQILYQGAPVAVSPSVSCAGLHIDFSGTIGGLIFAGTVDVDPPGANGLVAHVAVTTTGTVPIDSRPGEAFKTAMISTMNETPTSWDSASAVVGAESLTFPQAGWVLSSPVVTDHFGVVGGTSSWKSNAPSVSISLEDGPLQVTGWVTASSDPNDDNVLLWSAGDNQQSAWSYRVTVTPAP